MAILALGCSASGRNVRAPVAYLGQDKGQWLVKG